MDNKDDIEILDDIEGLSSADNGKNQESILKQFNTNNNVFNKEEMEMVNNNNGDIMEEPDLLNDFKLEETNDDLVQNIQDSTMTANFQTNPNLVTNDNVSSSDKSEIFDNDIAFQGLDNADNEFMPKESNNNQTTLNVENKETDDQEKIMHTLNTAEIIDPKLTAPNNIKKEESLIVNQEIRRETNNKKGVVFIVILFILLIAFIIVLPQITNLIQNIME